MCVGRIPITGFGFLCRGSPRALVLHTPATARPHNFRVGLLVEAFSHKPPLGGAVAPVPPLKREPFLCVLATEELSRADKGQIRCLKASGRLHYQRQLLEGNLTTSDLNKKSQWFNSQAVGLKLNDIFAFVKGLLSFSQRRKDRVASSV